MGYPGTAFYKKMNLAYCVKWQEQSSRVIECVPEKQLCSVDWSCRNTVAFSMSCAPAQQQGLAARCIHVLEPDRPWERTTFDSQHENGVARLLWHPSGFRLLSVDTRCQCRVWDQESQHMNVYQCTSLVTLPSDQLLAVRWLQQSNQIAFQSSIVCRSSGESRLWTDMFRKLPQQRPLFGVLGKSQDGFAVVSGSLKLHVVVLSQSSYRVFTHILPGINGADAPPVTADLAITSDGYLVVGVGLKPCAMAVYFVSLATAYGGQCEITMAYQHSFGGQQFSPERSQSHQSGNTITHLVLASYPTLSCVISVLDGNGTCHLEVWDNQGSLDLPNWTKTVASHRLKNGKVTSLKLMGLPSKKSDSAVGLSDSVGGRGVRLTLNLHGETHRRMRSIVVVGLDSGLTMCLDRKSLSSMATLNMLGSRATLLQGTVTSYGNLIPAGKRLRLSVSQSILSFAVSPNHCCVIGVTDIGDVNMFRLSLRTFGLPPDDFRPEQLARHLSNLFAYSLATGNDWWDILVCFCGIHMEGLFEAVIQQLENSFVIQPVGQREVTFPSYLAMLLTLWKCLPQGREVAMIIHSQLVLCSIWTLFRSLLSKETSVWLEDQLNEINKTHMSEELEKVVETVNITNGSPTASELLSCSNLIQLVVDVAANLTQRDGMALIRAASYVRTESLHALRELLVIIRQWVDIQPKCVPTFVGVPESMDCLSVLFKQVTKLFVERRMGEGAITDQDNDIDPTIPLLPAPPGYEQVDPHVFAKGYTSGRYGNATQMVTYEFDSAPQSLWHPLEFNPHDPFLPAGLKTPKGIAPPCDHSTIVRDVIWQLHLTTDATDKQMKQCTRCCGWSLPVPVPLSSACMIAWQCRWLDVCICGGQWKVQKGRKPIGILTQNT
ncbi:mediator of RNA polymerase II transcription subunit 16-like [Corticium candelabrum]|uniref:mediator of RNA polymerase II transcription subunit 16-like n=1 Tax=Corticium candelabrum TaxID=121492 RepID=UPI002E25CF39|nr:mediator of RNA polymerase II transcription subunit 16-like [Corticium candelabrum]